MDEKCLSPGCINPADYICNCMSPKILICENHLTWHISSRKRIEHSTKKLERPQKPKQKECQVCLKAPSKYMCLCRGLGVKLCPECFDQHSIQNSGRHKKESIEAAEFIEEEKDILLYTERRDQIDGILKVVKENLKDVTAKEEVFRMLQSRLIERIKAWFEERSEKISEAKKKLKLFEEEIMKCKYKKDVDCHWINGYLKEKDYSRSFWTVKMELNEDSVEQMFKVLLTIEQEPLIVQHIDIKTTDLPVLEIEKDFGLLYERVQSTFTNHGSKLQAKLFNLYSMVLDPCRIERISQVDISNCMLGTSGSRFLSIILPALPHLSYLNVCSNAIGPKGAKELASGLSQSKNLSTLMLSWNKLENKGLENLSDALSSLPVLKVLQLSWNNISAPGVQFISRALINCDELERLDLWNNPIGPEGMRNLLPALQYLPKLNFLDLNKTELKSEGIELLALALPKLLNLTNLCVANNDFGDKGAKCLSKAIDGNKKLQIIDMAMNRIRSEGSFALQDTMSKLQKESTLIISGNNFSKDETKKLMRCAMSRSLRIN